MTDSQKLNFIFWVVAVYVGGQSLGLALAILFLILRALAQ